MCDEHDRPYLAPLNCDYDRPGKIRSQLVRTTHTAKVRIAIYDGSASWQPWITPHGLDLFQAEVFHARVVPKDYPGAEQKLGYNIHGERVCFYTTRPRSTNVVPKLTDYCGNKFIPRRMRGVHIHVPGKPGTIAEYLNEGVDGPPIDLLMPWQELLSKGCLHTFLAMAKETQIHVNGEIITALVLEWEMGRSGIPSENVVYGKGTDVLRGPDGLRYAVAFEDAGFGTRDWAPVAGHPFINALDTFGRKLKKDNIAYLA